MGKWMFILLTAFGLAESATAQASQCGKFAVHLNWQDRATKADLLRVLQILETRPGFKVIGLGADYTLLVEQDCADLSHEEAMAATSDLCQELEAVAGVRLSVGPEVPYPAITNNPSPVSPNSPLNK